MSEFDRTLLHVLACPHCKGQLVYYRSELPIEATPREELVCRFDRFAYPIKAGVPLLTKDDMRVISQQELEQVPKSC